MRRQPYLRPSAAVLSLFVSLALAPAWAGSEDENLPNFQKTNDHVYRGGQPTEEGFHQLSQLGIKTVIDLRDIGEHSQADEQRVVTGLGMRYVSIPMKGLSAPKDNQVTEALGLLNDTTSGPVFIHCRRGADRTGTVIALYRIQQDGWENKRALGEAKSYGMSFIERAMQHYVLNYKPGVVVAGATLAPAAAQVSGVSEPAQAR